MKKGSFITFEGIDGCGKSTQLALVAQRLEKDGFPVLVTREPGGTPIGEKIREIIISPEHTEMHMECELLLFFAARAQHIKERIVPALENGTIVLCDRFQDATMAYQGFGRRVSIDSIRYLYEFAVGAFGPDRTYLFDLSVERSRERLRKMNKLKDRLEGDSDEFYERVRNGYLSLASDESDRFIVFDAERSIEELTSEIINDVQMLFNRPSPLSSPFISGKYKGAEKH
jgi:dTMP kinase